MAYTLAQAQADSDTGGPLDVDLYTVPASTEAVISTLAVANIGGDTAFTVAIRPAGAALSDEQYLIYESSLAAGESKFFTIGIALAATDVVTVRAATDDVAFTAFVNETVV